MAHIMDIEIEALPIKLTKIEYISNTKNKEIKKKRKVHRDQEKARHQEIRKAEEKEN